MCNQGYRTSERQVLQGSKAPQRQYVKELKGYAYVSLPATAAITLRLPRDNMNGSTSAVQVGETARRQAGAVLGAANVPCDPGCPLPGMAQSNLMLQLAISQVVVRL
jgi:hypothetical protein